MFAGETDEEWNRGYHYFKVDNAALTDEWNVAPLSLLLANMTDSASSTRMRRSDGTFAAAPNSTQHYPR